MNISDLIDLHAGGPPSEKGPGSGHYERRKKEEKLFPNFHPETFPEQNQHYGWIDDHGKFIANKKASTHDQTAREHVGSAEKAFGKGWVRLAKIRNELNLNYDASNRTAVMNAAAYLDSFGKGHSIYIDRVPYTTPSRSYDVGETFVPEKFDDAFMYALSGDKHSLNAGTSEGATKAWDSRGRGRKEKDKKGKPNAKTKPETKPVGKDGEKELSERAQRAKENYVPLTKEKYQLAMQFQNKFAKAIGGQVITNNQPFDVVKGNTVFEVKTIQNGKADRIEMRPDSRKNKETMIRRNKLKAFTVGFDIRQGKEAIYIKPGVGAFRFVTMEKVNTLEEALSVIKSKDLK